MNSNPELSDSKLCAPVSTTHTPGIKKNICPKEVYNQIGKISYIDTKNITNIARCQRNGLDTWNFRGKTNKDDFKPGWLGKTL